VPIASSAGVMAWPQRSHRQRAMLELSLKCMGCTHPHPQAAQAIIILTKIKTRQTLKRSEANDSKPKIPNQRSNMQSQGSQAKDLKPTLLGHGLAEWFREWGQGQGPQAKSPMDSKTCNNPKKTYIGSRWDSYKYIHVYCVYIYICEYFEFGGSTACGPSKVG
jgi:hypothetical protein